MIGLLLAAASWAGDAPLASYPLLTEAEIAEQIELTRLAPAAPPDGLVMEWPDLNGYVAVLIANETSEMVEVDWNRSVYVHSDSRSVGLAPAGAVSQQLLHANLPPSVIPPNASLKEVLVREDAMVAGVALPLISSSDLDKEVRVSLAVGAGETVTYIEERFSVAVDYSYLEGMNGAKQRLIEIASRQSVLYSRANQNTLLGYGGVIGGPILIAAGFAESEPDVIVTGLVLGGTATAIGTAFLIKRKKEREEMNALIVEDQQLRQKYSLQDYLR